MSDPLCPARPPVRRRTTRAWCGRWKSTTVLSPDADADREQCVDLARQAVVGRSRGDWAALYALGLAHYRAGQHEQAVQRLEESLAADQAEWSFRTLAYSPLAMAHHRLGQAAEARLSLDAAVRVLDH
ncbi:MAG TPA: hypothetical protein PK867_26590, partial [Pirellulales bacterium]|nr:hypothetical protein [Pirellulales bacterium]